MEKLMVISASITALATTVYVVATFLLWCAAKKQEEATKKQIEKQQKQFEETAKAAEKQAVEQKRQHDETTEITRAQISLHERQLEEQKRQFDETNRPVVDVTVDCILGKNLAFIFQNTGHKYARNIKVELNNEFLDALDKQDKQYKLEGWYKRHIVDLTKSTFNLGIGQTFITGICPLGKQLDLPKVEVSVTYQDDKQSHSDKFSFDLGLDNWRYVDTTDLAQIRKNLNKIAGDEPKSSGLKQTNLLLEEIAKHLKPEVPLIPLTTDNLQHDLDDYL